MHVPIILFLVTVAGFLLAIGYFLYTSLFAGRLLARCRIPGDALFDLTPQMSPVEISAFLGPGHVRARSVVRVDLEREGSWLWSRDVMPGEVRGLFDDAISVQRFRVETPGRYRIRGTVSTPDGKTRLPVAAIQVHVRVREPRPVVYVLAGSMLAGGFVSLLVVLA